ncbi:MAG: hypothetical protein M3352_04705, partial [Bacteroidota bacterium]|nr:hypothetical protein [Bacteroidota bacterium]
PPFLATAFLVAALADAKPLFEVDLLAELPPDEVLLREDVPLLAVPLLEPEDTPRLEDELFDGPLEDALLDDELPLPPKFLEAVLRVDEVPFEELPRGLEEDPFEEELLRLDDVPLLAERPVDELLEVLRRDAAPFFDAFLEDDPPLAEEDPPRLDDAPLDVPFEEVPPREELFVADLLLPPVLFETPLLEPPRLEEEALRPDDELLDAPFDEETLPPEPLEADFLLAAFLVDFAMLMGFE